jgi:hypothetical protein
MQMQPTSTPERSLVLAHRIRYAWPCPVLKQELHRARLQVLDGLVQQRLLVLRSDGAHTGTEAVSDRGGS